MANLREYFQLDGESLLSSEMEWPLEDGSGASVGSIFVRVHHGFVSNSRHVSVYIPEIPATNVPWRQVRQMVVNTLDNIAKNFEIESVSPGDDASIKSSELIFTNIVYIYYDGVLLDEYRGVIIDIFRKDGMKVIIRGAAYVKKRNDLQKPRAFISHDSRDKKDIALPLASGLQRLMCPVWYDEYSLHVGDSLRDSIEMGLKECHRCIFVITPNFLANGGWSKREYDSIFTREIVEKQNLILPIWSGVSRGEVYNYSPILADRVALNWSSGADFVVGKLFQALQ